jgi:hypothetical protein
MRADRETDGLTERQLDRFDGANSRCSQFCERALERLLFVHVRTVFSLMMLQAGVSVFAFTSVITTS